MVKLQLQDIVNQFRAMGLFSDWGSRGESVFVASPWPHTDFPNQAVCYFNDENDKMIPLSDTGFSIKFDGKSQYSVVKDDGIPGPGPNDFYLRNQDAESVFEIGREYFFGFPTELDGWKFPFHKTLTGVAGV